jgi:hypothetical protein
MAHQQRAELSQPWVGAFDDSSAFVAPQFPAFLLPFHLFVLSAGRDHFDGASLPSLSKWIRVVAEIRDHTIRLLARRCSLAWGRGLRRARRPQA